MNTTPIAVIFDGDDTLWHNQIYYDTAIHSFLNLMVREGFDIAEAHHCFNEKERLNVEEMGLVRGRFPKSMVDAYLQLCETHNRPPYDAIAVTAFEIGDSVFQQAPEFLEGAKQLLTTLYMSHVRLFLCTAGDAEVQKTKVAQLQLQEIFEAIEYPRRKDEAVFERMLTTYGLNADQTWMIGNSWRSDIEPALKVGLRCIWYHGKSWAYDTSTLKSGEYPVILIKKLHEVPEQLNRFTVGDMPKIKINV